MGLMDSPEKPKEPQIPYEEQPITKRDLFAAAALQALLANTICLPSDAAAHAFVIADVMIEKGQK